MKSVHAWVNVKSPIEDCLVANVTTLAWIYGNAFAFHSSLLIAQLVCTVRVFFDLSSEYDKLLFVILKTSTQVLFHFFDLGGFWESLK